MSRICEFSGREPKTGNNVSHSKVKTNRRWNPNLQTKRIFVAPLNKTIKVTVSARALKTITKKGGIVEALKQADAACLSPQLRRVKKELLNLA